MKPYNLGFPELSTGLSPSAKPFAMDSSSFSSAASEHEDSALGDYSFDLSVLLPDDRRNGLDDHGYVFNLSRDVETTTAVNKFPVGNGVAERRFLDGEDKKASSEQVWVNEGNSSPDFSKMPKLLIRSSKASDDGKLDLSEKSSIQSDQDDNEVDSPCWRGTQPHKALASGTKSVSFKGLTDDLNGFHGLNPLAPQFIPSNSKKNLETNGKKYEESSSSSLNKSLSSPFPSSSGNFSIIDPPETGRDDAATMTSILTHNTDESIGFVSQDSVSKAVNESRLDPLAPVFVPASSKLNGSIHEKQGKTDHIIALKTNGCSTSLPSSDKPLVKVKTRSGEVSRNFKSGYSNGVHESGSASSVNPRFKSEVGNTEHTKIGRSSNKSNGQWKLNPEAPQFIRTSPKPKVTGYEKNQAADDLSLVVNTAIVSPPVDYRNLTVSDEGLAQSSVYLEPSFKGVVPRQKERLLPDISPGSSSLKANDNFVSTKWFTVEPKSTISVKDNKSFKQTRPFHVLETAASSSSSYVKALPGYGERLSSSSPSPSPKMDVKKLLTTMHGLSELLALAHGSESSDSSNAQELDLINSTVQNLNLYIENKINEHAGNQSIIRHSSFDQKLLPNRSKLSIRDLQLPRTNAMTVYQDAKRKDQYSMVSGETVPDSRMYKYGVAKDDYFGQVVTKNAYHQNHDDEEQFNPQALFYRSLWLKAEAERSLMEYEAFLSNPNSRG